MFGSRIYTPHCHDFFDEVATLFINLASLNTATESFSATAATQIPRSPNHTLNLYGHVATGSFPIHTLMHGIVKNEWPKALHVVLRPATESIQAIPSGVNLQSDAAANIVTQLTGVAFLKFYERNAYRPKAAHSSKQKDWPELWRFAWLLRNAVAHGDKWSISDQLFPPTQWHGVSVSPSDSGSPWFNITRHLGGGDILLLLEELNASW
jgi:hypothetical protein